MININPIYNEFNNLLKYKLYYTIEDCKQLISKYNLDGIEINTDSSQLTIYNLEFLSEFTFLKALRICTFLDFDYKYIGNLTNLEKLSLHLKYGAEIDLSNLQNLKKVDIEFEKIKVSGLEKLNNLEFIGLFDFKDKNLERIKDLANLNKIKVKTSSIKNLEGIENLQKLDEILLANCRSLRDISQLTNLQNIKKVFFDSCTKIKDFDILAEIPSIEEIAFVNCKDIKSIKFFDKLPKLRKLVLMGNSVIEDNDLLPAKRLPLLRYSHKKTYNITLINTHFSTFY